MFLSSLRATRSHPSFQRRKMDCRVAALLAMMLVGGAAHGADLVPVRSITVSGMAERKVMPDEAHITVNLNAQDKALATACSAHDKKLISLMAMVKKAGIEEKKVSTQSSNIQPVYTYRNDGSGNSKRVFEGYRVQTNIDITVGDTSKLAGLMDAIANGGFEQGANTEWGNLMSVYYTLSNPDALRDELLAQAITNARAKAEKMADAAGADIGGVYQINENGTPQFQPVMAPRAMVMKAEMAGDAAMAPPAGEQNVQSNVTVTYELK